MKEELEKAIKENAKKASEPGRSADDAMKFTQAALNAAHVLAMLSHEK